MIDGSGNTVWGPEEKDTSLGGSGGHRQRLRAEEFTLLVNGSAYSTKTVDFEAE
ncbi:MAG: hypothetical protein ACLT5P_15175 [Flavonifractor plautii]